MRLRLYSALVLGWATAAAGQPAVPAASATPPPAASEQGKATTAPKPRRHAVRHRRVRHAALVPGSARPLAAAAPAEPGAPAPVPNEGVDPPHDPANPDTQVTPSLMSIHYPPVGEGYVQGSSPNAIDDRNTAKAPGVEMTVPIQPTPAPGH